MQDFAEKSKMQKNGKVFCAVRFWNVVGSSSSVIPLFKEQIRSRSPITLTHAETTRYFMSIEEAAQLVIEAGSLARRNDETGNFPGRIFLLDMGQPVRIRDLAVGLALCHDIHDTVYLAGACYGLFLVFGRSPAAANDKRR